MAISNRDKQIFDYYYIYDFKCYVTGGASIRHYTYDRSKKYSTGAFILTERVIRSKLLQGLYGRA